MPPEPARRWTGVRALPLAACVGIALLVVAAGASLGATYGPTRKLAVTVSVWPQFEGAQLRWTDVELAVGEGERVVWDWKSDGPLRFRIVSPEGDIVASVDDRSASRGSVVIPAAGACRAVWLNPSYGAFVHLALSVEVSADEPPAKPAAGPSEAPVVTDDGWQWVSEVAVALLLLLGLEVMVTVPMLVVRLRSGQAEARTFPVDFADAYISLGSEEPVDPGGLPVGAPLRPRPMDGALTVARGLRR